MRGSKVLVVLEVLAGLQRRRRSRGGGRGGGG